MKASNLGEQFFHWALVAIYAVATYLGAAALLLK